MVDDELSTEEGLRALDRNVASSIGDRELLADPHERGGIDEPEETRIVRDRGQVVAEPGEPARGADMGGLVRVNS